MAEAEGPPPRAPADAAGIRAAVAALRAGRIVAYPTETSYALGADPTSAAALAALERLKGRGRAHRFSLLAADATQIARFAEDLPPAALALAARGWPGPLTLVVPARPGLPAAIVNPEGGIAVRVTSDPVARDLCLAFGGALTATSANRTGEAAALAAPAAALPGVALVLDGGPRPGGASTIVDVRAGAPRVLRRGVVALP